MWETLLACEFIRSSSIDFVLALFLGERFAGVMLGFRFSSKKSTVMAVFGN
jgi:hypothetical protein